MFYITVEEADYILERRAQAKAWDTLPRGWSLDSLKIYWRTLTGDRKHKITQCMKKLEGRVDDPGAFCASLARKLKTATAEDTMAFKITATEKKVLLKRREAMAKKDKIAKPPTVKALIKKVAKQKEKIAKLKAKQKEKMDALRSELKKLQESLKKIKVKEKATKVKERDKKGKKKEKKKK
jgi:hypothetical protein